MQSDDNGNFKLIDVGIPLFNFHEYYITNEIINMSYKQNVDYFFMKIHTPQFYDKDCNFIKKRNILYKEIQNFYITFSKFISIVAHKYKKTKNTTNLLGDEFHKNHVTIIHKHVKYKFDHFELYNLINSAFKHRDGNYPIILNIKNPYTNEKFDTHVLINMYFILMSYGRIPMFFFLYFKNSFSKSFLYENYNFNLYLDNVRHQYNSMPLSLKIEYIDEMIDESPYLSFKRASIDDKIEYLNTAGRYYFISEEIYTCFGDNYSWLCDNYVNEYRSILRYVKSKYPKFGTTRFKLLTAPPPPKAGEPAGSDDP